jgi:acyl-CoA thioesterase I
MHRLLAAVCWPVKSLKLAACYAILAALVVGFGASADAQAQAVRIVALGASNTYGKGVARGQDYPAHLQGLLKQKGVNAVVTNAGINGDTTGGMLARLGSAVPAGTQIVILQPGGNDRRQGQEGQRAGNIAKMRSQLAARSVKVVVPPTECTSRHEATPFLRRISCRRFWRRSASEAGGTRQTT